MSNSVAFDISGSIVRCALSVRHELGGEMTLAEEVLIEFLKQSPLMCAPWTFVETQQRRCVYCFLFQFDRVHQVLARGIEFMDHFARRREQMFVTRILTMGSQAHVFEGHLKRLLADYNRKHRADMAPLEAEIVKRRELQCVRDALHYFNRNLASCIYQYKSTTKFVTDAAKNPVDTEYVTIPENNGFPLYPYLLVNFKAGVSFHLVTEAGVIKRLGGSPIGLATFLGLSQLFCGKETTAYETFLKSEKGDQTRVDMLVSDIYGGDYSSVGLRGTMVASTMGKLQRIRLRAVSSASSGQSQGEEEDTLPVKPFPSFTLEAEGSPRSRQASTCEWPAGVGTQCPTKSVSISIETASDAALAFRPLGKEIDVNGLTVVRILESEKPLTYTFRDRMTNEAKLAVGDDEDDLSDSEEETPPPCELDHAVYKEDIYKSLLSMTTFNVSQLAYLNSVKSGCDRIVFIGYYVDMPETLAAVQHCIQFWSEGKTTVNFVRIAAYLGAVGAALGEAQRPTV